MFQYTNKKKRYKEREENIWNVRTVGIEESISNLLREFAKPQPLMMFKRRMIVSHDYPSKSSAAQPAGQSSEIKIGFYRRIQRETRRVRCNEKLLTARVTSPENSWPGPRSLAYTVAVKRVAYERHSNAIRNCLLVNHYGIIEYFLSYPLKNKNFSTPLH